MEEAMLSHLTRETHCTPEGKTPHGWAAAFSPKEAVGGTQPVGHSRTFCHDGRTARQFVWKSSGGNTVPKLPLPSPAGV